VFHPLRACHDAAGGGGARRSRTQPPGPLGAGAVARAAGTRIGLLFETCQPLRVSTAFGPTEPLSRNFQVQELPGKVHFYSWEHHKTPGLGDLNRRLKDCKNAM